MPSKTHFKKGDLCRVQQFFTAPYQTIHHFSSPNESGGSVSVQSPNIPDQLTWNYITIKMLKMLKLPYHYVLKRILQSFLANKQKLCLYLVLLTKKRCVYPEVSNKHVDSVSFLTTAP